MYRTFHNKQYDTTWESWPAWLLCVVEIQIGAICASAPALKVFVAHYFRVAATKLGSSKGSEAKGGAYWYRSSASRSTATKDGYLKEPGSRHTVDEEGGIVLTKWEGDVKGESREVEEAGTQLETKDNGQRLPTRPPRPESVGIAISKWDSNNRSLHRSEVELSRPEWEAKRQPRTESMETSTRLQATFEAIKKMDAGLASPRVGRR